MTYILIAMICFYAGSCLGSRDCKRKFGIPKNAVGVDANGEYISR